MQILSGMFPWGTRFAHPRPGEPRYLVDTPEMRQWPEVLLPTFEHHPDGFGIGHPAPRISWQFLSDEDTCKNWDQVNYVIEVSFSNMANGGRGGERCRQYWVGSAQSTLVPWPADKLQSREKAYVRVQAYGTSRSDGDSTAKAAITYWSEQVVVEAALFDRGDWSALPITTLLTVTKDNKTLPPLRFRKAFYVPEGKTVASARLYITAFGVYEAYLNGGKVGDHVMAPGWTSYKHRHHYQIFDVASLLVSGNNVISVEIAEGWYAGRLTWMPEKRYNYGDELAVLAQLEVVFTDGENLVVNSDGSWKSFYSAIVRSEIYDGEDYDMTKEEVGWQLSTFNDAHWASSKTLDFPTSQLVAPDAPPARITERVRPVDIITTPSGKTIVDFGQNLVGVIEVASLSAPKGSVVTFIHAEVLENGELGVRPLRTAKCTDRVVSSGETLEKWHPKFTFHGFRYAQVDGWPGVPTADDFTALVLHSDMRRRGHFECSNELVNKLHQNIVWGMRGNFLSVPTDCPQRDERLGWTGDIQVFTPTANFLYDTVGMLSNWLEDVAVDQKTYGLPGLVVPDLLHDTGLFGGKGQAVWHDVTILTPWELYISSSDVDILRRQYESMVSWITYIPRSDDGLWDPSLWQLGDWLDPAAPPDKPGDGRTDGVFVANAYLVHITTTLAKICKILRLDSEKNNYELSALEVRTAFQNKYITPIGRLTINTQTAVSLAVCFDLYPAADQLKEASRSLSSLVRSENFHIGTGFAGTPIILPALTQLSHIQLAYRMLLEKGCPSWLYPVTMGATTIWERWDSMLPDGSINPGKMTSFNHYALGSVADWLHHTVGGLSPSKELGEEGWKVVIVKPVPGGDIERADVSFDGPFGLIKCRWEITDTDGGKAFEMTLTIPPNSKARVYLPVNTGVYEEERVTIVGSGIRTFRCPYVEPEPWPPKALSKPSSEALM